MYLSRDGLSCNEGLEQTTFDTALPPNLNSTITVSLLFWLFSPQISTSSAFIFGFGVFATQFKWKSFLCSLEEEVGESNAKLFLHKRFPLMYETDFLISTLAPRAAPTYQHTWPASLFGGMKNERRFVNLFLSE